MKLQVLGSRHRFSKNVFHLVGLDSSGRVVIRKRCSCRHVLGFTANLEVKVIGMEACSGAHFLGRALREQGHPVRLMPAQYVKPHLRTNKSDRTDARKLADLLSSGLLSSVYRGESGMRILKELARTYLVRLSHFPHSSTGFHRRSVTISLTPNFRTSILRARLNWEV